MFDFGSGYDVIPHRVAVSSAGAVPYQTFVLRREPVDVKQRWPIVFIHGCCSIGGTYWDITVDGRPGWASIALAAGYVTYVIDLPGHGRSPQPPDFALMGLDKAVAAVRELLGHIGPAVLVGHSMGGAVITRTFGVLSPAERATVVAAVLVDPARVAELNAGAPPRPGLENRLHAVADYTDATPRGRWYPDELYQRQQAWRGPESGRSFAEMVTAEFGAVGDPAPFAGIPTLLLAAEPDLGIGQDTIDAYHDHYGLPITSVGVDWGLPGHGHGLNVEVGNELIAARLLNWLAQLR